LKAKLTTLQKEDAKIIVKECLLRRLSRHESVKVLNERLKITRGGKLELNDLDKFRKAIKREGKAWMRAMISTRYAYFLQYKERMNEYLNYQKKLWELYYDPRNEDKPVLRVKIIEQLQNTSAAISQLYDILPEIAGEAYGDIARGSETVSELSKEKGSETSQGKGDDTRPGDSGDPDTSTEASGDPKKDPPPAF
jgi:hypothetical protein